MVNQQLLKIPLPAEQAKIRKTYNIASELQHDFLVAHKLYYDSVPTIVFL